MLCPSVLPRVKIGLRRAMSSHTGWPLGANAECGSDSPKASPTTCDVAAVPIRVSGKTAVVIVADELGDTMIGTRRLEELARQAGDAFARIVRTRASLR